jgi:HEAT repeat protein
MAETITLLTLAVLLACGLIAALLRGLKYTEWQRRRMFEDWQAVAAELGLSCTRPAEDARTLQGSLEGVSVRADLAYEQRGQTGGFRITLNVGSGGHIPRRLVVHSNSLLNSMARLVDSENEDQKIGDPDFDQLVELPALDAGACAALSVGAREQLSRVVRQKVEVREGKLVFDEVWNGYHDRHWLLQTLRALARLATSLSVTPELMHQRLADNALSDPSPGVRLQNLRFLADPKTCTPEELLLSVGRSLLADGHPRVRLLAGQLTGAEGHGALIALAADAGLELELRVLAVNALGSGPLPPADSLRGLLSETHPPELVCAALAAIAGQGLSALADGVVACSRSTRESVRAAAATTLGALALPDAEPLLIGLLSDDSAHVQRTSAEALGTIGSVAAVEPLLPLAEGIARPQLRQAARGAIGRIQSRLGDVAAGRVSLADDQELAGALGLADTADSRIGDLTLAEELPSEGDDSARAGTEGTPPNTARTR